MSENQPSQVRDLRPILPRNTENPWSRLEGVRDEVHGLFREACTRLRAEPMLLKSGAFVFPAWVSFEAWLPTARPNVTTRTSVTVTLEAKLYHTQRFEATVTWVRGNGSGSVSRLLPPSGPEVEALVRFLLSGGRKPKFRRVRTCWWQFWRPRQRVEGVRGPVASFVGGGLIAVGAAAFLFLQPVLGPVALVGLLLVAVGFVMLCGLTRRVVCVRTEGRPDGEPRVLRLVDSWQTVLFGLGNRQAMVRDRFLEVLEKSPSTPCRYRVEQLWHWGLDGKEEREQIVVTSGRGIVFGQVYQYGDDLYVGWDGHLNRGQWAELAVASGIDKETGEPVRFMATVPGTLPNSEYDLMDLSCLMEWTHAQMVRLLKQLIEEYKIDQEIDFRIQRGERPHLSEEAAREGEAAARKGGRGRKGFLRVG